MNRRLLVICLTAAPVILGQSEDYKVYTDAPRLLLNPQRLRLIKRENERQSLRWQQFDSLMSGGAAMPEPGFASALYYRATGQANAGQKAVEWALGNAATDLRQLALVFDWCGPAMNEAQAERLGAKLERALAAAPSAAAVSSTLPSNDVRQQSASALAAMALADRLADHGEAVLKPIVETWWRAGVAKRLEAGIPAVPREQIYALFELLHTVRDNLQIDLRNDAPAYFKALPTDHVVSHYPSPFPAPENLFRIPVYVREGEPDLTDAALSRAAELAMVAYDSNDGNIQFVQGWLMQDRYLMRGGFGIPYEFLWANPYQPGLSYFQLPLVFHNAATGHFFARTSWDEDATWLGYFDGQLQLFRDGKIQTLRAGATTQPVSVGEALILTARDKENGRFRASSEAVFILNLTPRAHYDVEIDDQELRDEETDAGGTLVLALPEGIETGIRVKRRNE
ncbi:MAG: hypothetical protein EXQ47_08325 [Bryobacterales bacterium]|nr:hypothetical protein [Bryobacterales bacterium]